MKSLNEFIGEFQKIGYNANIFKDTLAHTSHPNAWRVASILWQDAYAVMDIAIMFRYFYTYHLEIDCILNDANITLEEYDESIFFYTKTVERIKKTFDICFRMESTIRAS